MISDNHSYEGKDVLKHLEDVDEIWHAGDIGNLDSIKEMQGIAEFKAVYGNIDDHKTRLIFPENLIFHCEETKILITHIGGYPGRYNARVKQLITLEKPDVFICGHSHICKVMPDHNNHLLHMNPGAYGHHGFHIIRTILKFSIHGKKVSDLSVIELGRRGMIDK